MSAIPNEFEMNYRQSTISDFFNADQERIQNQVKK